MRNKLCALYQGVFDICYFHLSYINTFTHIVQKGLKIPLLQGLERSIYTLSITESLPPIWSHHVHFVDDDARLSQEFDEMNTFTHHLHCNCWKVSEGTLAIFINCHKLFIPFEQVVLLWRIKAEEIMRSIWDMCVRNKVQSYLWSSWKQYKFSTVSEWWEILALEYNGISCVTFVFMKTL